jgi:hypothetical protein
MGFISKYSKTSKFTAEKLLIIDKGWDEVGLKILDSELFLKKRIDIAKSEGKEILFLPGAYDILHAGHVTWIDQAIESLISNKKKAGKKIRRSDIFVVVPIESDYYVNVAKRGRHHSQGGSEKIVRPYVTQDSRLLALANLNSVDLTVAIPNPLGLDSALGQPENFTTRQAQMLLAVYSAENNLQQEEFQALKQSINTYDAIQNSKGYQELVTEFKKLQISTRTIDKAFTESNGKNWNEITWDIMWYLFLSDEAHYTLPAMPCYANRILSVRDDYNIKACYIARLAGISVEKILDTHITSTTHIISQYGDHPKDLKEVVSETNMYKFGRSLL